MTSASFIFSSARYYAKAHLGLLLGAFLASAILSGSLLVGDSVRASLRRVAELRLGKIQSGVIGGDRWFTEDLARKAGSTPLIIANGSVSAATGTARVNAVQVLGADAGFWKLSTSGKPVAIGKGEVAVNESLARKLNAKAGDIIVVRLEKPSAISRDAPLSGSTNQDIAMRRTVSIIVPAEDFGAFQLRASQVSPDTVFVGLTDFQNQLDMNARVNAMVGTGTDASTLESAKTLPGFALKLAKVPGSKPEWEISTDRVFLDDALANKLLAKLPGSYGALTYLVNSFESAHGKAPQSMATAVDRMAAPGTITVNQWLADDQGLKVGDKLDMKYFVVGLGREMKEQTASFNVGRIVPMTDPDVNRDWTPHFPGVSDVTNCRDWDPGIPMDKKAIRDKDEKYWTDYRATPKAFISLADGQKLWANRFGKLTSIRFADTGQKEADLRQEITGLLHLGDIGLVVQNFKSEAGAAAQGSVDFGGLFVGLSMFLIAAALVFAALLFVFMIERRASQVGLLMAVGWTQKRVRRALLTEAGVIAFLGSSLGLLGGVAYTKAALAGLNGVWGGATVGLKLVFAAQPETLAIALVSSFVVSSITLWWASRRLFKAAPRALLAGEGMQAPTSKRKPARWRDWRLVAIVSLISAAGLGYAGTKATDPEELGGMFFGAGMMLMIAGLALASGWMKALGSGQRLARSLGQIGLRNVVRRPGRSLAVLGMMASGIFLVAAVNVFRVSAGTDPTVRDSGTGGFVLMGESSLPVYEDLNSKAGREAFGLDAEDVKGVAVVPFRVRPGDDASCLNLNKAQNPQLVAVNPPLLDSCKAFGFSSPDNATWSILDQPAADGAVPAIADMNTAMWGLGIGVGDTLTYKDSAGADFKVRLVALLAGSVLQGKVIISEKNFLAKMPDAAGYRFFLIDAPLARAKEVSEDLTKQLEQRGLALEPSEDRFNAFSAVQNTYIGIFTVLGGLGVLLGTAGIGVLVARHVMERRGELGLMQALGFMPSALLRMIVGEHGALLLAGVALGVVSAGLAVWPNLHTASHDLPLGFMSVLVLAIIATGLAVCTASAAMALRGRLLDAVRKE